MPADDELDAIEAQLDPAGRAIVRILRQFMQQLREELARRDELIALLQRQLFGRRSEKTKRVKHPTIEEDVEQARAREPFSPLDLPQPAGQQPRDDDQTPRERGRARSRAKRAESKAQREALPVVEQTIDVTPGQLPAGYTLEDFRTLGPGRLVELVEHVQEHIVIKRYRLVTLQSKDRKHIITANGPPTVGNGAKYGPALHAHVVVSKCLDAIPHHRLAAILERAGAGIGRSVLCSLFHRSAELLEPLWHRLLKIAATDRYVNFDETPQPVLDDEACRRGWIWTMLGGRVACYIYSDSRAGATASNALLGSRGYLQVDGYSGYHAACGEGGRTRVGCWAHVRRKFYDARKNYPESAEIIELIAQLYRIEADIAEKGLGATPAHAEARREKSAQLVDKIEAWVDDHRGVHSPKSAFGAAVTYATNQRPYLRQFLADPNLALDNNASERALRIVALGRKNFLFVGHDIAGKNLAILHTIVATCRLNDIAPYEYIADVLVRVQTHPAARIDELLPMNWRPGAQCITG